MATVTINNYEQRQVDQRMLVNQLVDNGMGNLLRAGKIMAKRGAMKAGRKAKSFGGAMKTQAKAAGIQAKRGGLRATKWTNANPGKTAAIGAGASIGATAGIVGAHSRRRK